MVGFLSFLRWTDPHCSARPVLRIGHLALEHGGHDEPSRILVDASSTSPLTSVRSDWRSVRRGCTGQKWCRMPLDTRWVPSTVHDGNASCNCWACLPYLSGTASGVACGLRNEEELYIFWTEQQKDGGKEEDDFCPQRDVVT